MQAHTVPAPHDFSTFGELLKFLRRHRKLTQLELALAVGYSESQISHLEQNHRAPDPTMVGNRLIPALGLEEDREWAARLMELAAPVRTLSGAGVHPAKMLAGLHNLPIPWTSFVGREQQLAELVRMLTHPAGEGPDVRLVTLTGPGGAGKTRLAVQVSSLLSSKFEHGVWWVDLSSLSKPSFVPQTVATVFGIRDQSSRPMVRMLTDFLGHAQLLLILDNCEHLITASAMLTEAILRDCPQVKLLVTSREVLNIAGEATFRVPSLSTPIPDKLPTLQILPQYEAVRLFVDRAAIVSPAFRLTNENAAAVAQICQRLDGIPLAIELAAARLRMLSVQQIAQGLDDRFRLLTDGHRTAAPRHKTLHALVDWSYELLSEPERVLLCQLSIFAGGWTLEAAQALARTQEATDRVVIELLGRLIDKSLVMVEQRESQVRYRMLDTIRQYAQEKLSASHHRNVLERAHALYFLGLAEGEQTADLWFYPSHELHDAVQAEYDNLRAALVWCQSSAGDPQLGIELVAALLRFWFERGYWSEWRGWVEGALVMASSLPPSAALARAHFGLGTVLAFQSEFVSSGEQFERSLALYQELGDVPWSVYITFRLGWLARERGDAVTARRLMVSSLAQFRALGDNARIAEVLVTLGEVAVMQEDPEWAKQLLNEGMSLPNTPEGTRANLPWGLNHLGHAAQLEGDYERASTLHAQSLKLFSAAGSQNSGVAWSHQALGESALAVGDADAASSHLAQALVVFRDLGDRMGIAWCLAGFAALAAHANEHELAAKFWGASGSLRHSIGARPAPAVRATHERLLAASRTKLGDAGFQEWVRRGGEMHFHAAVAEVLSIANEEHPFAP